MVLVYRFGVTTIKAWDAPPRVSEIDLAEKYLENNLAALTLEQIKLLSFGQKDRLASDTAVNWKEKTSETPRPTPTKDLLKDMLVSAVGEVRIQDDGWRDDGKLWVGKKLGLRSEETRPIIVFVCDNNPTKEELQNRFAELGNKYGGLDEFEFFAVYLSDGADRSPNEDIEASGKRISVLSSRDMILKGLDLLNYAREIIDAFERTRVGGTLATLESSYVDLQVDVVSKDGVPEDLSKQMTDWLAQDSGEHIALTGEYGQGKSTALLKFCYDWARRFVESGLIGERVPLLIELRGKNPSETDPLGFLSPWCARYRLLPQQVLNLIKAGEAVVIFEGFDELRNAGRAFYRHQHFHALWRFAYPGTKIVFTGRPNFFLDQEEANRTLRSQEARKLGGDAFTSIWRLKRLEPNQITVACRSYEPEVRDGIAAAIEASPDFLDIVSRPSMLPVVATIWGDIGQLQAVGTPLTGAVLIEKYIQAVFSRKEGELEKDRVKHDAPSGSRYLVLPKQVRELLTVCVAWRMSGLKAKNTISRSEITEMVRDLYDTLIAMSKSEGVSASIAEGLIEFERRFADESPIERVEAIAAEICSAGLLVPDAAGGATNLRFPHKQFFEFLIAKSISIKTNGDRFVAADLLEISSGDSKVLGRLRSEPNAIAYLVEVVGPHISPILSKSQRISIQVIMILILTMSRLNFWPFNNINRFDNHKNYEELTEPNLLEYMGNVEFRELANKYVVMISAMITMSASAAMIMSFVKNVTSMDPIVLIAIFIILSILLLALIKIFIDLDQSLIGLQFLRIAWIKADTFPTSREHELRLAYSSMVSGKVEYASSIEDNSDYDQFLYPAKDFGKASN
jgi:hypothetical protein